VSIKELEEKIQSLEKENCSLKRNALKLTDLISKEKERSKALLNDYNFLSDILDCLPQQVWVTCEGEPLYLSKSMLKVLGEVGITGQKNMYSELVDLGNHAAAEMVKKNDALAAKSTGPLVFEETVLSKCGNKNKKRVFLSYKQRFESGDSGDEIKILGMSFDITERKAVEDNLLENINALELADRTKRTFVQNFRHDMKEPLSNILGASDCLLSLELDADTSVWVESIRLSADRLLAYMNKLTMGLTKSKEPLPVVLQSVDLKSEVAILEKSFRLTKKVREIDLNIVFSHDFPKHIELDLVRVQRIISNLISNALKYTQKGQVDVVISTNHFKESHLLEVSVADTGIGISRSAQNFIFSPLYRVANQLEDGSGLGLSIVKEFVDDLNGQITVESEEGVGSKFVLVLPIAVSKFKERNQ
jgi:signal transduction histidine kinase